MLGRSPKVEVVGEAGNGKDALELANDLNPDVLLLDVEMPGMKGYEVARKLKDSGSSARVLALSSYNEKRYILSMLTNGAVGYLTKDDASQYLLNAVLEIAAGSKGWISPNVAKMLGIEHLPGGPDAVPALSNRERRVLTLLADGKSDLEIGLELQLDRQALNEITQSMWRKLGAKNNLEAVLRAIQADIL